MTEKEINNLNRYQKKEFFIQKIETFKNKGLIPDTLCTLLDERALDMYFGSKPCRALERWILEKNNERLTEMKPVQDMTQRVELLEKLTAFNRDIKILLDEIEEFKKIKE